MNLFELRLKREEMRQELQTKVDEANQAIEKRDLEGAKKLKEQIDKIKGEITALDDQINAIIEDKGGEEPGEEDSKSDNPEEQRSHAGQAHIPGQTVIEPTNEQRDAFSNYLETREIDGGSLKTDSGFVVIPEQVVTEIMKLKESEFNLDQYVTVKPVSNGSGKFPVVRQSEVAALPEVAELAKNPELAVKPFYNLAYDIKTYRGYFLVSREAIDDAAVNVLAELMTWMARTIAATRNVAIIKAIKEGTPGEEGKTLKLETIEAADLDGIKDAINLKLKPNYEHNVAIVSQTAFAELDKLKDDNGNYLLQPDVKDSTQKRLLGALVIPLPDEMLGEASQKTIIIGNLKDAIVLFDRSQYQASWTDYMHYGEALMVAIRQDVRILDEKSAIVIDFGGGNGVEG